MMPKISVILPAYNSQRYIEKCFDSILSQSLKNFEVIAVDDGSTDRTGEIMEQISSRDSRLHVFHTTNNGVAYARNFAISKAKGEYLAFCDGDDTLPPKAYEKMYGRAIETHADIICGEYCNVFDDGRNIAGKFTASILCSRFMTLFMVPCVWNKLIRRDFLLKEELSFPNMVLGEDVAFLAALYMKNAAQSVIKENVYFHWAHEKEQEATLTHQYSLAFYEVHLECRKRLLKICKEATEVQDYVYLNLSDYLLQYLPQILDSGERDHAFVKLKEFLSEYSWQGKEELFQSIFGVSRDNFIEMTSQQYFAALYSIEPKERVLEQFKAGQIGFRYIIQYIKAWFKFKLYTRGKNE